MADTPVGALAVRIGADANQLIAELGRADRALGKHSETYRAAQQAASAFATAALAVAGAVVFATKSAIDNADAMYKAAQAAGMGTAAFSEYAYAASLSGISTQELSAALSKLNKGIADASLFTGDAQRAFTALGISVRNADGSIKSVEQVMGEIANKFAGARDSVEKSANAILIFGRAGAQMIPMLNEGAEGLQRAREEARRLGVSLDSEAGKAAEQFNDNLSRLAAVNRGYANDLMLQLLPALNQVTDAWVRAKVEGKGFHDEIVSVASFIQDTALAAFQVVAVVVANLAFMFKTAGREIGGMYAQQTALLNLDWKGFNAISQAMKEDATKARQELDDLEKRIMGFKLVKPTQPGGAMDMGVGLSDMTKGKLQAPADAGAGGDALARQIQDGIEAEQKMQAEAIQATVAFRDRELKADKDAYDARIKAMIEFYDREQELEIERGKALVEADTSRKERFEALQKSLASEEELENLSYERRIEQLRAFSDDELETLGGRQKVMEQMENEHQIRMINIRAKALTTMNDFTKASWQQQAATIFGEMANITSGVARHNRELFEINKVAAIANAIVNAYEGISKTMATYPYPLNLVMAALHAAAAFATVASIQRQTFGTGGGGAVAPSVSSTPAPAVSPVDSGGFAGGGGGGRARGTDVIINVHGETFDRKSIRNLIQQISEEQRDGGRVFLSDQR